jgi:hypothetical protein
MFKTKLNAAEFTHCLFVRRINMEIKNVALIGIIEMNI